jgi:hypothetical protein
MLKWFGVDLLAMCITCMLAPQYIRAADMILNDPE